MGIILSKYRSEVKVKNFTAVEVLWPTTIQPPDGVIVTEDYVENWGNIGQDIMWDVTFNSTDDINIAVGISNSKDHGKAEIEVEINGGTLKLNLPADALYKECTKIPMGSMSINATGFSTIRLRAKEEAKGVVGRLHFVELSGPAIENIKVHSWRHGYYLNASDVYLMWSSECSGFDDMFYNEIIVSKKNIDALFVVCGFYRGYVGLSEENLIFHIENPDLINTFRESNIEKHHKVTTAEYGNETRIHYNDGQLSATCFYPYKWKTNKIYRFVLTARRSSIENCVFYSGFFYKNSSWNLLATFKVMDMQTLFTKLYSSIQDCKSYHGFNNYSAAFGPAFLHVEDKGWKHLNEVKFEQGVGRVQPTDIDAGVTDSNMIYLSTGQLMYKIPPLYEPLVCEQVPVPSVLNDFHPIT